MLVGLPKETKDNEFRVSVIPATAEELVRRGHQVLVETGAGSRITASRGRCCMTPIAEALGYAHLPASEVLKR